MTKQTSTDNGLRIVRHFDTNKTNVFNAFGSAEAFAEWWAQPGTSITVKQFSFKPNGILHYKMHGNDKVMWGLFKFGNIIKNEVIEFTSSFSDENASICKPPFPMEFPYEIFNRITLSEENGITKLTMEGNPVNATEAQMANYNSIRANIADGFKMTFDNLEKYIKK